MSSRLGRGKGRLVMHELGGCGSSDRLASMGCTGHHQPEELAAQKDRQWQHVIVVVTEGYLAGGVEAEAGLRHRDALRLL